MTFLSSFLLGLVQGIAEFLPISSSGHLAIAQNLLGMSDAGTVPEFFDVLLHLGTLVAVFVASTTASTTPGGRPFSAMRGARYWTPSASGWMSTGWKDPRQRRPCASP